MGVGTVTNANDLYMPFQPPYLVDDPPPSSEDGSGLHSPTFLDSDSSLDGHRHDFRAPPPDLDIRSVEGLLASHFSNVDHHSAGALPAYVTHPYSHPSMQYPSYTHPGPSRAYEDERRFITRETLARYDGSGAIAPAPTTYLSGRIASSKAIEMPRPLTLPSLLPANPPVSSSRLSPRIGLERERPANLHIEMQYERTSPLSPEEPVNSPSSAMSAHTESDSNAQASRREPSLVVIACRQCRARKIRCDSTRPSCNNCVRRQNECHYDAVPKRRGPDKRPGTRQRSCKKRPADGSMPVKKKQKKSTADAQSPVSVEGSDDTGRATGAASRPDSMKTSVGARLSNGGGGLAMSGGDPRMGTALNSSTGVEFGNVVGARGIEGDVKPNMGLRLDMNFMDRPNAGYNSGPPHSGAQSHPRTHSTQSSQSFRFPSGSASPTTTMSLQPYSARSPELILPKSPLRREPFSMYEQLSPDRLSDSETDGRAFARQLDLDTHRPNDHMYFPSPSLNVDFNNKLWWDTLLNQYAPSQEQSEVEIAKDLSFLFGSNIHWLSFLNEHHFFRRLSDPFEREKLQPSLVLSALALATLLQSSELGLGHGGRERALWLRDTAQSYLEAAWTASPIDPSLAQAAMLIAIFESSAHPQHSGERACNSLVLLDQIIRNLALTAIDAGDPNACVFAPESVPSVPRPLTRDITVEERCYCAPPIHSPQLDLSGGGRLSPNWSTSISWDATWSVEEIQREETRRLCWAALSLAAAHTAHCAAFHTEPLDLFLSRPENYALLFPGEKGALADESGGPNYSPKQSIWALYCRSMLLWNSCLHLRKSASDSDKAEFALNAWMEATDIQDALDAHQCSTESHLVYMTREHVFNTRIAVSYEFRRRLQNIDVGTSPKFNRRQAEDWIYYQAQTAQRFKDILHNGRDPMSQVLMRRPFYVWWFMSQLAISMSLWVYDNTLLQALDLCKAFLVPLDVLSALWPCAVQRDQYLTLRKELTDHCSKAGVSLPLPPVFSLPISLL
ncbi:hypothetical protein DFH11DRAFT_1501181 [Phellopilus nigrolimitatus]|nr:hypothetical protein DFH11DRAFT_1501181 [Phellopilus nigrolimitatus]